MPLRSRTVSLGAAGAADLDEATVEASFGARVVSHEGEHTVANDTGEVETMVIQGTADDVNEQIAVIEGNGGTVFSVQLLEPSNGAGAVEVEIVHT